MDNQKEIAIIGYGYVGKALDNFFNDHYSTVIYDPIHGNEYPKFSLDKEEINKCKIGVICVPTPQLKDGSVDLSIIEEVIEWLETDLILIKSTIPPKTTEYLKSKYNKQNIVFSPEYIGEGKYQVHWWKDKSYPHPLDMKKHNFFIFGGNKRYTSKIIEFFKPITGPEPQYIQTNSITAELTKYMENSWIALKVSFCNEFYDIANTFNVDYNELRELFLLDGRVERMHTIVFENKRGFDGKCIPKDINGIVKASSKEGYEPKLLKNIINFNKGL